MAISIRARLQHSWSVMIRLIKGLAPTILSRNAAAWTAAVLLKLQSSVELAKSERSKYNHPEIKDALKDETKGKCAYCESKFAHLTYGDIEHIVAKSVDPSRWFDWSNLTLACDICNTNKGDAEGLIDPYSTDPEEEFIFVGSGVWPVPGHETADATIRSLKLNRDDLVGRRRERIEYLMRYADSIMKTQDSNLRELIKDDFSQELSDEVEYAAMSRAIARELAAKGVL